MARYRIYNDIGQLVADLKVVDDNSERVLINWCVEQGKVAELYSIQTVEEKRHAS